MMQPHYDATRHASGEYKPEVFDESRRSLKQARWRERYTGLFHRQAGFDRKPAFWKSWDVKTTLDLPDELMREVKILAIHEHKELKDTIAELIRKGIAASETRRPKIPKPVKLRGGFKPTTEDIEAAIASGRD